jgi:hypothetical protein
LLCPYDYRAHQHPIVATGRHDRVSQVTTGIVGVFGGAPAS